MITHCIIVQYMQYVLLVIQVFHQATSFNTSCTVALAPTNETFDAGFSNCWSQETADSLDWTVDAGGTPSQGTGPSDDFTGGGNYLYAESSFPQSSGDIAIVYSELIDISGLTNPQLRFLNHMYGSSMGTLICGPYGMQVLELI